MNDLKQYMKQQRLISRIKILLVGLYGMLAGAILMFFMMLSGLIL